MSGITEVLSHNRSVELRGASSGASFQPVEAKAQPGDDAAVVQILFTLVMMTAILLIAVFVIGRLIVAFAVDEFEAHWPRGRISHPE
jgi:hypothetical protein